MTSLPTPKPSSRSQEEPDDVTIANRLLFAVDPGVTGEIPLPLVRVVLNPTNIVDYNPLQGNDSMSVDQHPYGNPIDTVFELVEEIDRQERYGIKPPNPFAHGNNA